MSILANGSHETTEEAGCGTDAAHKRFHPPGLAIKSRLPLITSLWPVSEHSNRALPACVVAMSHGGVHLYSLCVSWQHLSLQAAAGGQSETKKCAVSAQTLFVTVSTTVWTDGTAPSIFLDRALVQLQFCPSGNVYLQSRHNDISLSAGSSNAIWAFLQNAGVEMESGRCLRVG